MQVQESASREDAQEAEGKNRVITPLALRMATKGTTQHQQPRNLLVQRSRMDAVISHQIEKPWLVRKDLHGILGDARQVLLTAGGWNLKKLLRLLGIMPDWLQSELK